MACRDLTDFWADVIQVRDSVMYNETERRNELKALELLYDSGYYKHELNDKE